MWSARLTIVPLIELAIEATGQFGAADNRPRPAQNIRFVQNEDIEEDESAEHGGQDMIDLVYNLKLKCHTIVMMTYRNL
jgi:hypothetical protein